MYAFFLTGSDTGSIARLVSSNNIGVYNSVASRCISETDCVIITTTPELSNGTHHKEEEEDEVANNKMDLSDLDLDLDEVIISINSDNDPDTENSLVPLSASRLRLLQDTTMIESALDLDSLEESTSSVGAGSQAGLLRKKDTL